MNIRELDISRLRPWENNPRLNDEAVAEVAKSIESFGFNLPILCDQNLTIIAGHTRWKAAKKLRIKSVPVIVLDVTDAQRRAFSIADNKTAEIAEWDFPKLREVLEKLRSEDIDFLSLGYSQAELEALLTPEEDLDWAGLEEYMGSELQRTHVFLPVKVRVEMKDKFKEAVKAYAGKHGIQERDPAIAAGEAFGHLLELKE